MKTRQQFRQELRAKRKSLSKHLQQTEAEKLKSLLIKEKRVQNAKHIGVYLSNDGELDLFPFIAWCWKHNIKTYLPVIHPFCKGHLLFLHYQQASKMVINKYGISEPKLDVSQVLPIQSIDILFTPLVAFDEKGNRLGMGGGYYDRTLAQWYGKKDITAKPHPIGLAHSCQQVESVPSESWDIPLPEIITPNQHFRF